MSSLPPPPQTKNGAAGTAVSPAQSERGPDGRRALPRSPRCTLCLQINRVGWGLYPTDMTGPDAGAHTAKYAAGRVKSISDYGGIWISTWVIDPNEPGYAENITAVGKLWAPWIPPFRSFLAGEEIALKTDDGGLKTDVLPVEPTCSNASDCTTELQAALDSCATEVVLVELPDSRSWITRPLSVRQCEHRQRLELKPGVVLQAIKDGFHGGGDMLLRVFNVTGFTLHGPGAFLRMHRADYDDLTKYTKSESRHALGVYGSADVTISGEPGKPLTVMESGGDGCCIAGFGTALNSRNITIHDVNFTRNYRQGISVRVLLLPTLPCCCFSCSCHTSLRNCLQVIGVAGLTVTDTELSYTGVPHGTPPMAGIDFEPDSAANVLTGVLFTNVTARDNGGSGGSSGGGGRGFQFTLNLLTAQTPSPVDVTFVDCTVIGGKNAAVSMSVSKNGLPPGGHITFTGLRTFNTGTVAILAEDKPSSLQLNIVNATIVNVSADCPASSARNCEVIFGSQSIPAPILITGQTSNGSCILSSTCKGSLPVNAKCAKGCTFNPPDGCPTAGVYLHNVTVHDTVRRPAINMSLGKVSGITGDLRLVNPAGCLPARVTGAGSTLKVTCAKP